MNLPAVPENLQNIPVVREYLASLVASILLGDSANLAFLVANFVNRNGSTPMTGILDMGGFRIIDLGHPLNTTDAVTKEYVDNAVGSGGGGGGGGSSVLTVVTQATGTFSTSSGTPAPLPNSSFSVTVPTTTIVAVDVCTFAEQGFSGFDTDVFLTVAIKDTDTLVSTDMWQSLIGGQASGNPVANIQGGSPGIKRTVLTLAAGTHNFQLTGRIAGSGSYTITYPLSITVTQIEATVAFTPTASITFQEVKNAGGTATTNATTTYALIPNTLISLVLPSTQYVIFDGFATMDTPSNSYNTQLGVRIDGVDYDGTAIKTGVLFNTNDLGGLTVAKGLLLGAGTHTAQLVLRKSSGTGSAEVVNSALQPSYLRAIYTSPNAITPLTEVVVESDSASDTTSSTSLVATAATVSFSISASSVVRASAFTTAVANGGSNGDGFGVEIAMNVDGTSYTPQRILNNSDVGASLIPMAVFKDITLAPGSHTITLYFATVANTLGAIADLSNTHLSVVYHA
jgi:hypothetical protein